MSDGDLFEIAFAMRAAGHPDRFVARLLDRAYEFRGVASLMQLWSEEVAQPERDELMADLRELLTDIDESVPARVVDRHRRIRAGRLPVGTLSEGPTDLSWCRA